MAVGRRAYLDNYSTLLNGGITNSATSITVDSGAGVATALSAADYISMTIDNGTTAEIIHVTAEAANVLTVERGQEGTTGTSYADNTPIECRETAASFDVQNLTGVDLSSGAPAEGEQLRFNASGVLTQFAPGGYSLVETQTLGGAVADVTFDILTPGVGVYKIVFDNVLHGTDSDIQFTVAYDSGGTTYAATNYDSVLDYYVASGTTRSTNRGNSTTQITLAVNNDAGNVINGELIIFEKLAAENFQCLWELVGYDTTGPDLQRYDGGGSWQDAVQTLVEVKLTTATGTFDAGATFHLLKRDF